ncbi:hypothetical protein ACTFIY_010677 [Dictyostelium cf. discoideum]
MERPIISNPCVSDTLYYKYFNHDKNIRLLKGSIRSDARTNVNSDQVVQWPKDQQDFLINKVPLERIWNIDETAIKLDETAVKYVVNKTYGKPLTKPLNYSHHVTMIGCISASGRRLPHYSIIKAPKTSIGKLTITTQGTIIFNESGWVDTKQKKDFINYFGETINKGIPKPYPLTVLYLDNHSSNLQEEVAEILNGYNIHCYTFPANSTHLLQPLDLLVFGIFKRKLNQTINNLKRSKSKKDLPKCSKLTFEELSDVIETSWDATASPITIKNAFEMVKIDWKLIKTSYLDQLEKIEDKSIVCVSKTLIIAEKPSSNQIGARKIGFQVNSLGVGNKIKIDEAPKKRGRPSKVTINSTINVLNVNIQNNFIAQDTDSTTTSVPHLKLKKNGQPRKQYTKKLKPTHDYTENQQISNKISEID